MIWPVNDGGRVYEGTVTSTDTGRGLISICDIMSTGVGLVVVVVVVVGGGGGGGLA